VKGTDLLTVDVPSKHVRLPLDGIGVPAALHIVRPRYRQVLHHLPILENIVYFLCHTLT
jgi:hypothetical protein